MENNFESGKARLPQQELIAKTFMGLEPVLAKELRELGANDVQIGRRMVSFTGDKELMYRANFQLHTAIRILKPISHFKAKSADDVYNEVMKIDWTEYLDFDKGCGLCRRGPARGHRQVATAHCRPRLSGRLHLWPRL